MSESEPGAKKTCSETVILMGFEGPREISQNRGFATIFAMAFARL